MSITDRLQTRLSKLKHEYEQGGNQTINIIRSGTIIRHLEDWCVEELIQVGISHRDISTSFKASGFFKTKKQDVAVLCKKFNCSRHGRIPPLTVNVRSQLSSIQKNFDTLYERLIAETLNLHLADPEHVAGFLYLIPLWGFDEKALKKGNVQLNENYDRSKYVESFEKVNLRSSPKNEEWKYERVCLLTVDFSTDPPEPVVGLPSKELDSTLYHSLDTTRIWRCLDYRDFFSDLVEKARARFGEECI